MNLRYRQFAGIRSRAATPQFSCAHRRRTQLVHVHTLISQSFVKRFNEGVFHRFARPNKIKLDAPAIGPAFQMPVITSQDLAGRFPRLYRRGPKLITIGDRPAS